MGKNNLKKKKTNQNEWKCNAIPANTILQTLKKKTRKPEKEPVELSCTGGAEAETEAEAECWPILNKTIWIVVFFFSSSSASSII